MKFNYSSTIKGKSNELISILDQLHLIKSNWQAVYIYITEHINYTLHDIYQTEIEELLNLIRKVDNIVKAKMEKQKSENEKVKAHGKRR